MKKAPYSEYGSLENEGAQVTWGDPADPSTYPDDSFDVVYDNNGKKLDVCKPLIDTYKVNQCQRSTFHWHISLGLYVCILLHCIEIGLEGGLQHSVVQCEGDACLFKNMALLG